MEKYWHFSLLHVLFIFATEWIRVWIEFYRKTTRVRIWQIIIKNVEKENVCKQDSAFLWWRRLDCWIASKCGHISRLLFFLVWLFELIYRIMKAYAWIVATLVKCHFISPRWPFFYSTNSAYSRNYHRTLRHTVAIMWKTAQKGKKQRKKTTKGYIRLLLIHKSSEDTSMKMLHLFRGIMKPITLCNFLSNFFSLFQKLTVFTKTILYTN